ncbi:MAG: hypothetical protein L0241_03815 [Planctomycetia bacterium]|nr:hypothetical protein [Planctomycetia bacterium]
MSRYVSFLVVGMCCAFVAQSAGAQPEKVKAPAPAPAPGVNVCGLGALAPSGKVLFVPGVSGVEAISLYNGKRLWETKDTGVPLVASSDFVISQIEVKGKKNQVKLILLDATTGERLRDSDVIEFPEWVSVSPDYGRGFRSAARLDKADVLFIWEARAFTDGGEPPPDPDPNAKTVAGAFRLDVKTGRVSVVKDYKPKEADFPEEPGTQTKWSGWVFRIEEKWPEVGFPRTLTKRTLIANHDDGKVSWKIPIAGAIFLPPRQ